MRRIIIIEKNNIHKMLKYKKMMDEACHSANALVFIKDLVSFPLGYKTVVGERGVKLSGG